MAVLFFESVSVKSLAWFLYLSSSFVSDTTRESQEKSYLFTSNVFLFIEDRFVLRIVLDLKIRGLIPLCCVDFIVENK